MIDLIIAISCKYPVYVGFVIGVSLYLTIIRICNYRIMEKKRNKIEQQKLEKLVGKTN